MGELQVSKMIPLPSPEFSNDDQSQLVYSSDDSCGDSDDAYFLRSESGGYSLPSSPVISHPQFYYGTIGSRSPFQGLGTDQMNLNANGQLLARSKTTGSGRGEIRRFLRRKLKEEEQREHLVRQLRGKEQPEEWHDVVWLVLFLFQFFAVICFACLFVGLDPSRWHQVSKSLDPNFESNANTDVSVRSFLHGFASEEQTQLDASFQIDFTIILEILGFTTVYASLLSALVFGLMVILAKSLIHVSLFLSMVLALTWAIFGQVMEPFGIIAILGFSSFSLVLAFTLWVWERIPFAATNMQTALYAVCDSAVVILLGLGAMLMVSGWCFAWFLAFIGMLDRMRPFSLSDCTEHIFFCFFMLISFCWTNAVITVNVASAVGRWWFSSQDSPSPCCSLFLAQQIRRSMTTSLGSICYGSLVLIPAQLFRTIASMLCLPGDTYFKSCNRWACTYIGLYGYSFQEAGFRARQLFDTREWTSLVNDNLVTTMLWMASIVIGGSTGVFGILVIEGDKYALSWLHHPVITSFLLGSSCGVALCSTFLVGVVDSAVNTVLVCFAAAPIEFQTNYPRLSHEMREAWMLPLWEPVGLTTSV